MSPPPPPAARPLWWRAALLATLAVLVFAAGELASKGAAAVRSPYSKDYGEGCVMAMTQLLAERGSYFPPMDDYPYVHGNYPPLFIALNLAGYRAFGPGLAWPRALSLAFTLALVAVVFALVRRRTGSVPLAAAAGLLLLAPWFVQTWAVLARVDMLACALSALGLLLFEQGAARTGGRRHLCWPVFALAALTKQNALLAPAAALFTLAADRERRRDLPAALALCGALLLAGVGGLQWWSGGLALRHLVTYTATADYEWGRMWTSYRDFLVLTAPLWAAALLGFARCPPSPGRRLYVLYALLNLVALATIAKAGAGQNYFIEPFLAVVLLAAAASGWTAESPWPVWMLVAAVFALGFQHKQGRLPQALRSPERAEDFAGLDRRVRATAGPILSENLAVLVVNRKPVLVEPFDFMLLSRHGVIDPGRVVADCRAGRFPLVVSERRFAEVPGLGECLAERYQDVEQLGPYSLLRPRP